MTCHRDGIITSIDGPHEASYTRNPAPVVAEAFVRLWDEHPFRPIAGTAAHPGNVYAGIRSMTRDSDSPPANGWGSGSRIVGLKLRVQAVCCRACPRRPPVARNASLTPDR